MKRGLEIPDRDLPRIERTPRRAYDPAFEARLERLKAARNRLATEFDLQPGVLCPNGTLEAIARANPATLEDLGRASRSSDGGNFGRSAVSYWRPRRMLLGWRLKRPKRRLIPNH